MDTSAPTPAAAACCEDAAPRLLLRRVAIDTYRENVAYLNRDCELYRAEGFQALAKVEVGVDGRRILATLNVVDDPTIVSCGELGLSEDAGARHLAGHPDGRGLHWRNFVSAYNALPMSEADELKVAEGAKAAFNRVHALVEETFA